MSHTPIFISGNGGFLADNSSTGISWGSGTEEDPFIIEGWEIWNPDGPCIWIQYSGVHFTIRNCLLSIGISINPYCIFLVGCSNGLVADNACFGAGYGIELYISSCNNRILNNTCSNTEWGIGLEENCDGNLVSYNDCTGCPNGIHARWFCNDNAFIGNGLASDYGGGTQGILLQDECHRNAVLSNDVSGDGVGIHLLNKCNHTAIENNTMGQCILYLQWQNDNNTITNNTCRGLAISGSCNNTVANNHCSGLVAWPCTGAIALMGSSWDNKILNNTCSDSTCGISLESYVNRNLFANNTCSNNDVGILLNGTLYEVSYNIFVDNVVSDSGGYGINITPGCHDNTIWNNTFYHNNGAGDSYDPLHVQANDDGYNNWWNSTDGYGNWWSDWTLPDDDMNGIVDIPYDVNGLAGGRDYFPRTTAVIPEFGSGYVLVCIVVGTVMAIVGSRRLNHRKS